MKILVFSDSHSYKNLMNRCIDAVKPDAVIHLGDHYDDTDELVRKYFDIPFHQVRGNCDSGSVPLNAPAVLCYAVGGVRFYMTHGHLHNVKMQADRLIYAAKEAEAQAVLFGQTHSPVCLQLDDGMWIINPGSCNHAGGSACLIETKDGKISVCRIIRQTDLEALT